MNAAVAPEARATAWLHDVLERSDKIADLDDHMRRPAIPGDPPYAWARRHIANARHARRRLA